MQRELPVSLAPFQQAQSQARPDIFPHELPSATRPLNTSGKRASTAGVLPYEAAFVLPFALPPAKTGSEETKKRLVTFNSTPYGTAVHTPARRYARLHAYTCARTHARALSPAPPRAAPPPAHAGVAAEGARAHHGTRLRNHGTRLRKHTHARAHTHTHTRTRVHTHIGPHANIQRSHCTYTAVYVQVHCFNCALSCCTRTQTKAQAQPPERARTHAQTHIS